MTKFALAGRDREVAQIDDFLGRLAEGSAVLVLEGEAGVGKSALLHRCRERVSERNFVLLVASPTEREMPLEFAGLADLLDDVDDTLFEGLPEPQRHAMAAAVRRKEVLGEAVDSRTVAAAVLGVLRSLAGQAPTVLVIDDVPWLDLESARVLAYALRRCRSLPVGLIAARRRDWVSQPLPSLLDSLDLERLSSLEIGPLDATQLGELVKVRLALELRRPDLVRLHRESAGNAMLALHLLASRQPGRVTQGQSPKPESLRAAVDSRVSTLNEGEKDLLLVAALSGDPSRAVVLAAALDSDGARDNLERLFQVDTLVADGDRLTFGHPLLRSAIVDAADSDLRRSVHSRLALVETRPELQLRHQAMAAVGPSEKASEAAEMAARFAADRGASDTAAELAELSAVLTGDVLSDMRVRRLRLAAAYWFRASNPTRAIEILESLVAGIETGLERAITRMELARYRSYIGDPLESRTQELTLALEEVGDDKFHRATVICDLGLALANMGDVDGALAIVPEGRQCAQASGNLQAEAILCSGEAWLRFCRGEGVRTDLISRLDGLPPSPVEAQMEHRYELGLGHLLRLSDDLAGARQLYESAHRRASEHGIETDLPLLLYGYAETEVLSGNLERASALAEEGCALARGSGSPIGLALATAARAQVHGWQGHTLQAEADVVQAIDMIRAQSVDAVLPFALVSVGPARLSVGDYAGANDFLRPYTSMIFAAGCPEPGFTRFVGDDIEAMIRIGKLAEATAALDIYQERAMSLGRRSAIGAALRCRALLIASLGDPQAAEEPATGALVHFEDVGMPLEWARSCLVAGEIHRRARHRSLARKRLQAAAEMFERLGANMWADRARFELDRSSVRTRRTSQSTDLTKGERQVVDLAIAGMTNAQIARRLFMGQRTVESHLSHIYKKLGVNSRNEMLQKLLNEVAVED